jgi:hypothetical protein
MAGDLKLCPGTYMLKARWRGWPKAAGNGGGTRRGREG